MATKTFATYKPSEEQFIELADHEGVTHTFKLSPSLPGTVILDFMFVSGTDDSSKLAKAITKVLDKAIAAESKEEWNAFIDDERNGVNITTLSEIVGHVTSVLSGNPRDPE